MVSSVESRGTLAFGAAVIALFLAAVAASAQGAPGKPFTVAEEIELAQFGDPNAGQAEAVQWSPDGKYVAALTERGRLDLNRPEDTLRIYRAQDLLSFLRRTDGVQPTPFWAFNRSTDDDGPIISHWRWLKDSSGIAFLERRAHGRNQLVLADLEQKAIENLTPDGAIIKGYDISDRLHYVYAVADSELFRRADIEGKAAAIVGTGRSLLDLLFPLDSNPQMAWLADRSELWAVNGGTPFQVKDKAGAQAVILFSEGQDSLALSPDGQSLVTALAVPEVTPEWEKRYPPPYASYPYRLRAGKQYLATPSGSLLVSRYVQIDLRTGTVRSLSDGPTGQATGWETEGSAVPVWSQDGQAILLPRAYVAPSTTLPPRACVAVVNQRRFTPSCVERLEGPNEKGGFEKARLVDAARFEGRGGRKVRVSYYARGTQGTTEYQQTAAGTWKVTQQTTVADSMAGGRLEVTVMQGMNDPPVLTATDSKTQASRVIWDPNPQLKDFKFGKVTVFQWQDKSGRNWKGGLYKPVPYELGHRYPLVIQTHGFSEKDFRPSGIFPTATAARALAAAGMMVLQVDDCPISETPEEGPCNVDGYESAVSQLVKEDLVDPQRIGIIGFSRTCFYVMEALTTSTLHITAASITAGIMEDYFQYLLQGDANNNIIANEADVMIGSRPFGAGLQQWLRRSPLFNIDKVSAALQVVAQGRSDLPDMWGPYAAMRYLHKPVDLILLNNAEHMLSNPAARMASQGGSVDWFRFWLQDYEDPSSAKTDEYKRWHELRRLQQAQNSNAANPTANSPTPQ